MQLDFLTDGKEQLDFRLDGNLQLEGHVGYGW